MESTTNRCLLAIIIIVDYILCQDGTSNSPFNQGSKLYETPYSSSVIQMGGSPYMTVAAGSGAGMMGLGGRTGPLSWPSQFFHGGAAMMTYTCIKGNIVCPVYCLVQDENGCKSCPCGPANGMGVPVTSGHVTQITVHKPDKEKQTTDCMATIICMLSCKDGYRLGPKGQDGCQTCSCSKKESKDSDDKSKNKTDSGGLTSPFHVGQMPGGASGGFGSTSGSGGASPSGAGMPSPFSVGGGSGTPGGFGASGGSGGGFNPMFPGAGMTGGSGSGHGMGGAGGGKGGAGGGMGGAGCVGPFCASASSQSSGIPGRGSLTGTDSKCVGPSCSAKNGEHLLSQLTSATESPGVVRCPNTDLCVRTCTYTVKLGPAGADGCHSCACVMKEDTPHQELCDGVVRCMLSCKTGYEIGTTTEQNGCPSCVCREPPTAPPTPAPTPAPSPAPTQCDAHTLACMTGCRHGYHIEAASSSQCPVCKCLPPPTTQAPPKKQNVYSVLRNCPEAVHCMTTCSHGYSMATKPGQACPTCSCNTVAVETLVCTKPLSCPLGCKVGYKCDTDGCPTCNCIHPTEVGATHTTTYLTSSLVCYAHFTCISRCPFGYQTGHNGCPTCQCLQPITGTHVVHEVVNTHVHTTGCTGGSCGEASKWTFSQILKSCPKVLQCVATCTSGFEITAAPVGHCPDCLCQAQVLVSTGTAVHHFTGSGDNSHKPGVAAIPTRPVHVGTVPATTGGQGHGHSPAGSVSTGQHIPTIPPPGGAVVVTGNGWNGQAGHGSGHVTGTGGVTFGTHVVGAPHTAHVGGGKNCIGPACSAPNGLHTPGHDNQHVGHLSPNQCANVLTCVMTCNHGYKLGAPAHNGCPSCDCLA